MCKTPQQVRVLKMLSWLKMVKLRQQMRRGKTKEVTSVIGIGKVNLSPGMP